MENSPTPVARGRWVLALLVIPFIALLFPGWYAHADPTFIGFGAARWRRADLNQ